MTIVVNDLHAFQELETQYESIYSALEGVISVLTDEVDELYLERGAIQNKLTDTLRLHEYKQDLLCKAERDLKQLEALWVAQRSGMAIWKDFKDQLKAA